LHYPYLHSFPTRRSSDLEVLGEVLDHVIAFGFAVDDDIEPQVLLQLDHTIDLRAHRLRIGGVVEATGPVIGPRAADLGRLREGRSEEHTSELQSRFDLVC